LGLVLANDAVQYRIGKANAAQIITACEEFHAANGKFPQTLNPSYATGLHSAAGFCGGKHVGPVVVGHAWPKNDVVEIPRRPSLSNARGKTILKFMQERGIIGVSSTL
jgi:hypothetical protein